MFLSPKKRTIIISKGFKNSELGVMGSKYV